jgi:hypothetical protein
MTVRRQQPVFASDIRRLGGTVSVVGGRDRITREQFYQVDHISRGGDLVWRSRRIFDEEAARQAAVVLSEFTGSAVKL